MNLPATFLCTSLLWFLTPATGVANGLVQPGNDQPVGAVDHIRLVWTTDPASTVTVSWSTADSTQDNRVYLALDPKGGVLSDYTFSVPSHRDGRYTHGAVDPPNLKPAFYHHARVTGLIPGEFYWFVVVSDGQPSAEYHFQTAPRGDVEFSLLHGGDSRTGHAQRQMMNRFIAQLVEEKPSILALAHGGDYVGKGESWSHWRTWLEHDVQRIATSGRVLPTIPTRGNHDDGPLFDEVFDSPGSAGLNWYRTTLPFDTYLFTLNTNISVAGQCC